MNIKSKGKFIRNILLIGIMLLVNSQRIYASDWQTLASQGAQLESIDPQWPIILTISPSAEASCAVTGMYLGQYMCSLEGEAWPDGNSIKIKVKGKISSNARLMIYGTLTYSNASNVKIDGDMSVDVNGSGRETPCTFYLEDKTAKAEAARIKAERYKSSPEYRIKTVLQGLIHSGRITQKKDRSIGHALGAYASSGIDGAISEADANKTFDVSKGHDDGVIENCELAQEKFQYTLKGGSHGSFSIATRCSFTTDNIRTSAFASSDLDKIIFICGPSKNMKVFLIDSGQLYTIKKSAQKPLLNRLSTELNH